MALRYGENPHQSAALYGAARQRESPARSSCTARSFPTTTWWIWTPPGNWSASSSGRRRPSSSTPIRAAARSRRRSPRAIARRSRPIRCRRSAACWHSIGRWTRRPRAEIAKTFIEAIAAPDYSAEALAVLGAKKNLRLMRVAPGRDRAGGEVHLAADFWRRPRMLHRLDRAQRRGEDQARADRGGVGGAASSAGRSPST